MFCLAWAFDRQSASCNYVVGNEEAIRELYGILMEKRDMLSYSLVSNVPDGKVIMEYSKKKSKE